VPDYTIARYLTDMCAGQNPLQLSAAIKGEARIFSFVVREVDEGTVDALNLPDECRVMLLYRDDEFLFADAETPIQKGDEVVIVARNKVLSQLEERWSPTIDENTQQMPT
jgi:trk system potassium uptake protein TrkA